LSINDERRRVFMHLIVTLQEYPLRIKILS
jgi:hypothetical protein